MTSNFIYTEVEQVLHAVFFDYKVKIISAPDDRMQQREQIIAGSFEQSYLLQAERIAPNLYAVIGADQEMIKGIYASAPKKIEILIPYGVSLRAFLSKQDVSFEKLIVFVDDFQSYVLVSIFDGLVFSSPRKVSIEQLSTEIKRTIQNYLAEFPAAHEKEIEVISSKDLKTKFPEIQSPSLEGLRMERFIINFELPQNVVNKKRLKIVRNRLKTTFYFSIFILLGIFLWMGSFIYKRNQVNSSGALQIYQQNLFDQLKSSYPDKLPSLLAHKQQINYSNYYYQFLRHLPSGYIVKDFSFYSSSNGQWMGEGEICPLDSTVILKKFVNKGIFKNASVTDISINNSLGQKIVFMIPEKTGEI